LHALLPSGPEISLHDFPPVSRAVDEAVFRREHAAPGRAATLAEAVVVEDADTTNTGGGEVLELMSSGPRVALSIPCRASLPLLVVQLKDLGRFCGLEVDVVDFSGRPLRICASNHQTAVRATASEVSLPLALTPGWNFVRLDLSDLCPRVFGAAYGSTTCVTVTATCRIARIWLECRPFADAELPPFLRTIQRE
jgi:hypothetical protein